MPRSSSLAPRHLVAVVGPRRRCLTSPPSRPRRPSALPRPLCPDLELGLGSDAIAARSPPRRSHDAAGPRPHPRPDLVVGRRSPEPLRDASLLRPRLSLVGLRQGTPTGSTVAADWEDHAGRHRRSSPASPSIRATATSLELHEPRPRRPLLHSVVERPRPPPQGSPPSLDALVPLQTPVRPPASLPLCYSRRPADVHAPPGARARGEHTRTRALASPVARTVVRPGALRARPRRGSRPRPPPALQRPPCPSLLPRRGVTAARPAPRRRFPPRRDPDWPRPVRVPAPAAPASPVPVKALGHWTVGPRP
nr:translation initiation factor IF-2-like [Aegilops tauschii subsp. strangulata]